MRRGRREIRRGRRRGGRRRYGICVLDWGTCGLSGWGWGLHTSKSSADSAWLVSRICIIDCNRHSRSQEVVWLLVPYERSEEALKTSHNNSKQRYTITLWDESPKPYSDLIQLYPLLQSHNGDCAMLKGIEGHKHVMAWAKAFGATKNFDCSELEHSLLRNITTYA